MNGSSTKKLVAVARLEPFRVTPKEPNPTDPVISVAWSSSARPAMIKMEAVIVMANFDLLYIIPLPFVLSCYLDDSLCRRRAMASEDLAARLVNL